MKKVQEYYNSQTDEIKDIISSNGIEHTIKIMLFEFSKSEKSTAVNWAKQERKGRERMRKLYAEKLQELKNLTVKQ